MTALPVKENELEISTQFFLSEWLKTKFDVNTHAWLKSTGWETFMYDGQSFWYHPDFTESLKVNLATAIIIQACRERNQRQIAYTERRMAMGDDPDELFSDEEGPAR
jgi:hypothetical protein